MSCVQDRSSDALSLPPILQACPRERNTYLFSATMTSKVKKLQRASLTNPVKVEVSSKYATVRTLVQQYLFMPAKHKDCYFTYVCNELAGLTAIVFVATCAPNALHAKTTVLAAETLLSELYL
eukprot:6194232-Pleurochrysis_carterae.AAC.2